MKSTADRLVSLRLLRAIQIPLAIIAFCCADDAPTLSRWVQMSVRIVHGANEGRFTLAGQTVRSIAKSLRDAFNIPQDAQAFVEGNEVSGDHVVADGDIVEFVRTFGRKSGLHDLWSEREVTEFFGASAIQDMAEMEIHPVSERVFTSQQLNDYLLRLTNPNETKPQPSPLVVDFSSMTLTYCDQAPIEIEGSLIFKLLNRLNVRHRHYVRLDTLKRDVLEDEFVECPNCMADYLIEQGADRAIPVRCSSLKIQKLNL